MTRRNGPLVAALRPGIRAAFLELDPMGIADEPEAQDEYDDLVKLVAFRIAAGDDTQTVATDIAALMDRSWSVEATPSWIGHLTDAFNRVAEPLIRANEDG